MTSLLLVLTLTSNTVSVLSDTTPLRIKTYEVNINKGTSNAYKGYMQGIDDTSIQVSQKRAPFGTITFDRSVSYTEMDKLTVHRPGALGRGAALGSLGGSIIGAIVGAITYRPCPNCWFDFGRGVDMAAGAVLGFLPGVGIGMIIGGRKNRFTISRTKQNFDLMRRRLSHVYGNRATRE